MAGIRIRNRFSGKGDQIKDSGVNKWINVFGDVQIIQNLERLKTSGQRKILKKAIAAGVKPIAALAKEKAPEKLGLLKRSIKWMVTKMISGKVYVDPRVFAAKSAITGQRWKRINVKNSKGLKAKEIASQVKEKIGSDAQFLRPAKYAHLLEFGTKNMPPHPFMRPAIDEGRNRALKDIANAARDALKKEMSK